MKLRKLKAAAAMGSLTATVALLAGMTGAHAQGAPGAGSYPGSFLIPGTNTSFSVGGYVKLDYFYDFTEAGSQNGGLGGGVGIPLDAAYGHPATGGHGVHGVSQMSAAESRFNIQTRTPTAYGEVKTFIEGDFTNPNGVTNSQSLVTESNSTGLRLRQAYGTIGPFLAGQTFDAFRDLNAEPEDLDFGGENVPGANRQPQIRYTYDTGIGLNLIGAIENPSTGWVDTAAGATADNFAGTNASKIPDFMAGAVFTQPWGHVSGRAIFRDLYDHQFGSTGIGTGVNANTSTSQFGYGLALGGDFKTFGKDDLVGQIWGGEGMGRYLSPNCSAGGCPDLYVNSATNSSEAVSGWGVMAGYQHWWADNLRSNLNGSYVEFENDSGFVTAANAFTTLNKHYITAHVNLIWSPVPSMDTGPEFIYTERETESGQTGNQMRFQYSAKWKF
ncbi:MAG TPA: DcaP family trimeric outer membrane transporter [Stellaceae bacterium]|nr:DcaP family trimeric outer membrane transporter [Stellaceae bacterium]